MIHLGGKTRPDARTGALGVVLHSLTHRGGREEPFQDFLSHLSIQHADRADINFRQSSPIEAVNPVVADIIGRAEAILTTEKNGRPLVTLEGLLASMLNTEALNDSLASLFGMGREAIIDAIIRGGRERTPPKVLNEFAGALGRTLSEEQFSPSPDAPPDDVHSKSGPGIAEEAEEPDPEVSTAMPFGAAPTGPGIAGTINDTVKHGEDLLDVNKEAQAFARLIASNGFEPPLAIGVFGHWGTGKTFFMERIEEALKKAAPDVPKAEERKIVRIKFNAWHYMETNVWASLVDVIFRELDAWLRRTAQQTAQEDKVEDLFEGLATAQSERLEAIESFAEKLQATEEARQTLETAAQKRTSQWTVVAEALIKQPKIKSDFERVVSAYGLDSLRTEGAQLEASVNLVRQAAADGGTAWSGLRARGVPAWMLVVFAAAVVGAPALIAWMFGHFDIAPSISATAGLIAATSGGVGFIGIYAKKMAAALRRVNDAFDAAESERAAQSQRTLDKYTADLDGAKAMLQHAEETAADALHELHSGSATGRIAAFIRSRTEDGTYSKHLGIIDTIRRDFEQLTALMATQRDQAKEEIEALKRIQEDTSLRIEAMRKRYLGKGAEGQNPDPAFEPVDEALKRMAELNRADNSPGMKIDRIVLFIDDLDRCPPKTVYQVLQAVHLFLNFPLFVVVVGVDTRWMETSLIKELDELVDGSKGATAQDYLEKIFQIPYWTRRMDEAASKGFVKGVMKRLPDESQQSDPPPPDSAGEATDEEQLQEARAAEYETRETVERTGISGASELSAEDMAEDAIESLDDDIDQDEEREEGPPDTDHAEAAPRPVILSAEERTMIEALSPYAGNSPRQLLRFVNVYGLIKSVSAEDGTPLIDPNKDLLACQALLAQLAISTGAPHGAKFYFDTLSESKNGSYPIQNKSGFQSPNSEYTNLLKLSKSRFNRGPLPENSEAEIERIQEILKELCVQAGISFGKLTQNYSSVDSETLESYEHLFAKLRATAPIARRYTFAAIDAVLAAEPDTSDATEHDCESESGNSDW